MAAQDYIHNAVCAALVLDGWKITAEHYRLAVDNRDIFIDIAAERELLIAERENEYIAVEVKSFVGSSPVADLRDAIGQYVLYAAVLKELEPQRVLFLAVDLETAEGILAERIALLTIRQAQVRIIVVDTLEERIVRWIS